MTELNDTDRERLREYLTATLSDDIPDWRIDEMIGEITNRLGAGPTLEEACVLALENWNNSYGNDTALFVLHATTYDAIVRTVLDSAELWEQSQTAIAPAIDPHSDKAGGGRCPCSEVTYSPVGYAPITWRRAQPVAWGNKQSPHSGVIAGFTRNHACAFVNQEGHHNTIRVQVRNLRVPPAPEVPKAVWETATSTDTNVPWQITRSVTPEPNQR